ncbi:hypothetical protein O6H91_Y369100 [Diphasiastrum complanatum]|nr:hypothetical protein O6H91_Y369100 [Diphasiastrum complanatum]
MSSRLKTLLSFSSYSFSFHNISSSFFAFPFSLSLKLFELLLAGRYAGSIECSCFCSFTRRFALSSLDNYAVAQTLDCPFGFATEDCFEVANQSCSGLGLVVL